MPRSIMEVILIVGSDGRTHTYAWALKKSALVKRLYVAPGNGGTASMGPEINVAIPVTDHEALIAFCLENGVTCVVVSPEEPLVKGLADKLVGAGVACFGPVKAAAILEGSKVYTKKLLLACGIPTGRATIFEDFEEARRYVQTMFGGCVKKLVVKPDGLTAGKGVVVAESEAEAVTALHDCMVGRIYGTAGDVVLLEEFLEGSELSVMLFCDGSTYHVMPASRDHKRQQDGDKGPNTGGMGAFSPVPMATPKAMNRIRERIIEPFFAELEERGIVYCGIIYFGLMLTKDGPKVLEINCRGGDPETEVVLPRLITDFGAVVEACVSGTLDQLTVEWSGDYVVDIVLASAGYPDEFEKDKLITGLDTAAEIGATVFHAGTKMVGNEVRSSGGRVVNVTARGNTFSRALRIATAACNAVRFDNKYHRTDIGRSAHAVMSRPKSKHLVP